MTAGIVFFGSTQRETTVAFYRERLGFETWLEQPGCSILRFGNLLVGFCDREDAETDGFVTVVLDDRAAVDAAHADLSDVARGDPVENERYRIYQFFADDPEGRTVEVQAFLHETPPIGGAGEERVSGE